MFLVGLAGWFFPGGGYLVLKETGRALIIFVAIAVTFVAGLYIGSIGVVDPIGYRLWYVVQMMSSPLVAIIGHHTQGGGFPVYGRPNEMGQIYTSTAGLLNLLCIVNSVYMAYLRKTQDSGAIGMLALAAIVMAEFTIPEEIGTNPRSLLLLLPLLVAIAVIYKATKVSECFGGQLS